MLTIPGTSALSSFRIEKLLNQLQGLDSNIQTVTARFLHFVQLQKSLDLSENQIADLSANEMQMLQRLLDYGYSSVESLSTTDSEDKHLSQLWVVPRLGTISPWSSKASEIAERCGLVKVKRIERGIEYSFSSSVALSSESQQKIAALLHDRMTQQVVTDEAQLDLFAEHDPKPLQTVAIIEQGREALVKANTVLGLALSADEIDYLTDSFKQLGRNPLTLNL
jgi:phosphoribosylformylglycinamidine synthase